MSDFVDCASLKWLGMWYGPVLSSEMVMRAATMAMARFGVPGYVHADRGKEFQCRAFSGGFRTIHGQKLFSEVDGIWKKLGVRPITAKPRNAQAKLIERWHEEVAKFDKMLPGATGSKPVERPELTAILEAEHEAWKQGHAKGTRLLCIDDYVRRFVDWCEQTWNASPHGGKYLRGMSPNEVYNVRMPESGCRKIPLEELELLTADCRRAKVARGGEIHISVQGQRIEYENPPKLFAHQGEEVTVFVSRMNLSRVKVYDGRDQFICDAKKSRFTPGSRMIPSSCARRTDQSRDCIGESSVD